MHKLYLHCIEKKKFSFDFYLKLWKWMKFLEESTAKATWSVNLDKFFFG